MKILITEPRDYSPEAISHLREWGEVNCLASLSDLPSALAQADVVVIRLGVVWDEKLLKQAPRLKFIVSPTTGLDHIDLKLAQQLNIEIVSLKGEQRFLDSIPSTAEHSFGLILALLRKIPQADQHVISGQWNRQVLRGNNLRGKSLGILGFGRVGHQMAQYGKAFGMIVKVYDPASNYSTAEVEVCADAESLFRTSDILSIHIPQNDENMNFVSAELIALLPQGSFVINTSRGGIWDEEALAGALQSGQLAGIATDVIKGEYDAAVRQSSPLLQLHKQGYNIIITPHIAGATIESMHSTELFCAQKLIRKLRGEQSQTQFPHKL